MKLADRFRRIVDGMPDGSMVTLRVEQLREWLDDQEEPPHHPIAPADLTVTQIAERFGRSPQTVRDWIKEGKLRAYLFNEKEYRITPSALAEFEEAQRRASDGQAAPPEQADLGAWRKVGPS